MSSYERDIKLAADIGSTTLRFSFEWARIEPQPGVWDMEAVRRCAAPVPSRLCMHTHTHMHTRVVQWCMNMHARCVPCSDSLGAVGLLALLL
jgi:hypothetical protein